MFALAALMVLSFVAGLVVLVIGLDRRRANADSH
jgi:hypothetical protein